MMVMSPGPRAPWMTFPSRNWTPRSYCLRIRTDSAAVASATSSRTTITGTTMSSPSRRAHRRDARELAGDASRPGEAMRWALGLRTAVAASPTRFLPAMGGRSACPCRSDSAQAICLAGPALPRIAPGPRPHAGSAVVRSPSSRDPEVPRAVDRRRSGGGDQARKVGGGLASLRVGVHVAPGEQPQRRLLIGRQVRGVDEVLDPGEPLAAAHLSLDLQPH